MDDTFYFDGDFRKRPKTDFFCVVCQKDLKKAAGYVLLGSGDVCELVHPAHLRGDEVHCPVGSECIKKIPPDFWVDESWTGDDTLVGQYCGECGGDIRNNKNKFYNEDKTMCFCCKNCQAGR